MGFSRVVSSFRVFQHFLDLFDASVYADLFHFDAYLDFVLIGSLSHIFQPWRSNIMFVFGRVSTFHKGPVVLGSCHCCGGSEISFGLDHFIMNRGYIWSISASLD